LGEQLAAAAFVSVERAAVLHTYEGPYESALVSRGASIGELGRYRSEARREAALSMGKLMDQAGIERSRLLLHHGNPFHLLDRLNPNWLIVLSRGRSRARRVIFGSVTRTVVAYGHSDVLLV
jgi:nucleotide-binding universal stress UspA family protein